MKEGGFNDIGPIFIVGCSRTGSQLLMHSLNKHPEISIIDETKFLPFWQKGVAKKIKRFEPFNKGDNLDELVNLIYSNTLKENYWHDIPVDKEYFSKEVSKSDGTIKSFVELLMKFKADKEGKSVMGAKFLTHFYYVPKLFEWFPNAKVIHLLRDPGAVYMSQLNKKNKPNYLFEKGDPFHDFGILLYTLIQWTWSAKLHKFYAKEYNPKKYTSVKFEDLVSNPDDELKRISEFIGVGFSDNLLNVRVFDSSFKKYKESGFREESAYRWKKHIKSSHKLLIDLLLKKDMERLGYR